MGIGKILDLIFWPTRINKKNYVLSLAARKKLNLYIKLFISKFGEGSTALERKEMREDILERISEYIEHHKRTKNVKRFDEELITRIILAIGDIESLEKELLVFGKKKRDESRYKKLVVLVFWVPHVIWILGALIFSVVNFLAIFQSGVQIFLGEYLTYLLQFLLPIFGVVVGFILWKRKRYKKLVFFFLTFEFPVFLLSWLRPILFLGVNLQLSFVLAIALIAGIDNLVYVLELYPSIEKKLRKISDVLMYPIYFLKGLSFSFWSYVYLWWILLVIPTLALIFREAHWRFVESFNDFRYFNPYDFSSEEFFYHFLPLLLLVVVVVSACVTLTISQLVMNRYFSKLPKLNKDLNRRIKINFASIAILVFVVGFMSGGLHLEKPGVDHLRDFERNYLQEEDTYESQANAFKDNGVYDFESYRRKGLTTVFLNMFVLGYEDGRDRTKVEFFVEYYCDTLEICRQNRIGNFSLLYYMSQPTMLDYDFNSLKAGLLYSQIYDESIERAEKRKILRAFSGALSGNPIDIFQNRGVRHDRGANLFEEDNEYVKLTDLNIEVESKDEVGSYSTVYTFRLENKTLTRQEIYLEFEIPENSLISDLKLGENLEFNGIIAPKAAANTVYQRSLGRGIDPAIIQQIGPELYRLRVFPIPEKRDEKRSNIQYVQFTVEGYAPEGIEIIGIPYSRNVDYSDLKVRGSLSDNYLNLINFSKEEIAASNTNLNFGPIQSSRRAEFELKRPQKNITESTIATFDYKSPKRNFCEIPRTNTNQTLILIDTSYGHEKSKDEIRNIANEIFMEYERGDVFLAKYNYVGSEIKMVRDKLDLDKEMDELFFFGYTKSESIFDVLDDFQRNTNGKGQVFIIRESNDFEFLETDEIIPNYSDFGDLEINMIFTGERKVTNKEFINGLIQFTDGGMYSRSELGNLLESLKNSRFCSYSSLQGMDEVIRDKLVNYQGNNAMLIRVENSDSRLEVARLSSEKAIESRYVDMFNSIIAVETERQQQDLERLSERDSAYDLEYDIGAGIGKGFIAPEARDYVMFVVIVGFSLWIIGQKRFGDGKQKRNN